MDGLHSYAHDCSNLRVTPVHGGPVRLSAPHATDRSGLPTQTWQTRYGAWSGEGDTEAPCRQDVHPMRL